MSEHLISFLVNQREAYCFPPSFRADVEDFGRKTLALLFPHFAEEANCEVSQIEALVAQLREDFSELLNRVESALEITLDHAELESAFFGSLTDLIEQLEFDAKAMAEGDPAAQSVDEVKLAYPGFRAIAIYRVAHLLHGLEIPLLPRLLTEMAHRETGIDIHPGAIIGRSFCIDHGTGVVIGETAVIGNGVKIYQGVTLGALTVQKALADVKRHPTIGDNTVLYANATVLGGETVIGHDCVIGANAWVTKSVPPFNIVGRDAEFRPRRSIEDGDLEYFI